MSHTPVVHTLYVTHASFTLFTDALFTPVAVAIGADWIPRGRVVFLKAHHEPLVLPTVHEITAIDDLDSAVRLAAPVAQIRERILVHLLNGLDVDRIVAHIASSQW